MTHRIPPPGTYRRIRDGAHVEVVGCTGNISFTDTVAVQGEEFAQMLADAYLRVNGIDKPTEVTP